MTLSRYQIFDAENNLINTIKADSFDTAQALNPSYTVKRVIPREEIIAEKQAMIDRITTDVYERLTDEEKKQLRATKVALIDYSEGQSLSTRVNLRDLEDPEQLEDDFVDTLSDEFFSDASIRRKLLNQ